MGSARPYGRDCSLLFRILLLLAAQLGLGEDKFTVGEVHDTILSSEIFSMAFNKLGEGAKRRFVVVPRPAIHQHTLLTGLSERMLSMRRKEKLKLNSASMPFEFNTVHRC